MNSAQTMRKFSAPEKEKTGKPRVLYSHECEWQGKIKRLEKINARSRALMATVNDIVLVSGVDGKLERIGNHALYNLGEQVLQEEVVLEELMNTVEDVRQSGVFCAKEFQVTKEGEDYFFEARLQKTVADEVILILRDLAAQTLLERQVRQIGEYDSLTGLKNRRKFEERMGMLQGHRCEKVCLLLFEIQGLKEVNNTKGHLRGDQLIVATAQILDSIFEEYGLVARIGSDEFGVILEGHGESVLDGILGSLEKRMVSYNIENEFCPLSLKIGSAYHQEGVILMETLYQIADERMMLDNQKGRCL